MDIDDDFVIDDGRRSPSPAIYRLEDAGEPAALQVNNLYKNPLNSLPDETMASRLQKPERRDISGVSLVTSKSDEEPMPFQLDSYTSLRLHAIYVFSHALQHMSTDQVMSWANMHVLPSTPLGIEWIDDKSLVLVFSTSSHALQGLSNLLINDVSARLKTALDDLSDIYSESSIDSINTLSTYHLAQPFLLQESNVYTRLAVTKDQKQRGAREKSKWYSSEKGAGSTKRARDYRSKKYSNDAAALDAELDSYVAGETLPIERRNGDTSPRLHDKRDSELDALERRSIRDGRGSRRRRVELKDLDKELDAYSNGVTDEFIPTRTEELFPSSSSSSTAKTGGSLFERLSGPSPILQVRQPAQVLSPQPSEHAESEEVEESPLVLLDIETKEPAGMRGWAEEPPKEKPITPYVFKPSKTVLASRQTAADLLDGDVLGNTTSRTGKSGLYGWDD